MLTPSQKSLYLQCPTDWESWGRKWRNGFGHVTPFVGSWPAFQALRDLKLIETRVQGDYIQWRRVPENGTPLLTWVTITPNNADKILRRGKRKWLLQSPVRKWLGENAMEGFLYRGYQNSLTRTYYAEIAFANSAEAVMFKLRWM